MQDTGQDFRDFLSDAYATGILLCCDGNPIGYMSGTHISELNSDDILKGHREIRAIENTTFYVESIAILESHRSILTLDYLIHEMVAWLKENDYGYAAAHIRIKNGFSKLLQRRYHAHKVKTYTDWMEFNEPFDYLIMDFSNIPTLPNIPDHFFQTLRRMRAFLKQIDWPD